MSSTTARVGVAGVVFTLVIASVLGWAVAGLAWGVVMLGGLAWGFPRLDGPRSVRQLWVLFAFVNACWVASDAWRVFGDPEQQRLSAPGPSTLAAIGVALLCVVIVWVVRLRSKTLAGAWVDGVAFICALLTPLWIAVMEPAVADGQSSWPVGIWLVLVLATLWVGSVYVMSDGIWSVPAILLAAGVVGDVTLSVVVHLGGQSAAGVDFPLFLPGYVTGVFVAFHPQLATVFERGNRPVGMPLEVRVWILAGVLSLPLLSVGWCFVTAHPVPTEVVLISLAGMAAVIGVRWMSTERGSDWAAAMNVSLAGVLVVAVGASLVLLNQSARGAQDQAERAASTLSAVKQLDGQLLRAAGASATAADRAAWAAAVQRLRGSGAAAPAAFDDYAAAGRAAQQRPRDAASADGSLRATEGALIAAAGARAQQARATADRRAQTMRLFTVAILTGTLVLVCIALLRHTAARRRVDLQHQETHDTLTGLPNRVALERQLSRAAPTRDDMGGRTLVLLDLDDFKAVNDSLGHSAGDALVHSIAARLETATRGDQLLVRIDGDAFAILVPAGQDAAAVAHRVLATLATPVELGGAPHTITGSVGIAEVDEADDDRHTSAFRDAELAMYQAKRITGNSMETFVRDMHQRARDRITLAAELRSALSTDELHLVYQPIVDLRSGRVRGYEALIRWNHPVRGPLSPAEFIPIAEQSALIVDLGGWVLRTATRQLASWQREWKDDRYVSVNVAATQLSTRALKAQVSAALTESGLAPERLVLEVTESSLIEDIDDSIAQMQEVRALGARFALDDFGTGYSSLSYLRRFPVDVLKVDKSFIDALNEPDGRLLVRAIINMAASLHLHVVAEGIEDAGQAVELQRYECDLAQGFHFSRPLPAAEVPTKPNAFKLPTSPNLRVVG